MKALNVTHQTPLPIIEEEITFGLELLEVVWRGSTGTVVSSNIQTSGLWFDIRRESGGCVTEEPLMHQEVMTMEREFQAVGLLRGLNESLDTSRFLRKRLRTALRLRGGIRQCGA